jgi:hypothetical protein
MMGTINFEKLTRGHVIDFKAGKATLTGVVLLNNLHTQQLIVDYSSHEMTIEWGIVTDLHTEGRAVEGMKNRLNYIVPPSEIVDYTKAVSLQDASPNMVAEKVELVVEQTLSRLLKDIEKLSVVGYPVGDKADVSEALKNVVDLKLSLKHIQTSIIRQLTVNSVVGEGTAYADNMETANHLLNELLFDLGN